MFFHLSYYKVDPENGGKKPWDHILIIMGGNAGQLMWHKIQAYSFSLKKGKMQIGAKQTQFW